VVSSWLVLSIGRVAILCASAALSSNFYLKIHVTPMSQTTEDTNRRLGMLTERLRELDKDLDPLVSLANDLGCLDGNISKFI